MSFAHIDKNQAKMFELLSMIAPIYQVQLICY